MKKVVVEKHAKWWYVIIKNEAGENLTMANFSTKKKAMEVQQNWAKNFKDVEAV